MEIKGTKILQYFKVYLLGSESHTILVNIFTTIIYFCSFLNIAFYTSHLNGLFITMQRLYRKELVENLINSKTEEALIFSKH